LKLSGPAPDAVTNKIYSLTTTISEYLTTDSPLAVDLSKIGSYSFTIDGSRQFVVEVIDSVTDYLQLMKEIFDFEAIKKLLSGDKYKILLNAMHGGLLGSASRFNEPFNNIVEQ
jgi:phosphoglucomutase